MTVNYISRQLNEVSNPSYSMYFLRFMVSVTVKTEEELVGDAVAFWSVHGVGFLGRHSSFTVPPHAPPPPLPGVQRGAGKLSG